MAVKLNEKAFNKAKKLVGAGDVVKDDRNVWSEHQPSARKENEFIREHGLQPSLRKASGFPLPLP